MWPHIPPNAGGGLTSGDESKTRIFQPDLNFSAAPGYGPVLRAEIRYNDFLTFARHRRLLIVIVKTVSKSPAGIYLVDYRNPVQPPPDLWPVPACEQPGEQVSVDDASFD